MPCCYQLQFFGTFWSSWNGISAKIQISCVCDLLLLGGPGSNRRVAVSIDQLACDSKNKSIFLLAERCCRHLKTRIQLLPILCFIPHACCSNSLNSCLIPRIQFVNSFLRKGDTRNSAFNSRTAKWLSDFSGFPFSTAFPMFFPCFSPLLTAITSDEAPGLRHGQRPRCLVRWPRRDARGVSGRLQYGGWRLEPWQIQHGMPGFFG